jgi:hypothetical protein
MKLLITIFWNLVFTFLGGLFVWIILATKEMDVYNTIYSVGMYCVFWVLAVCLSHISRN